jgi:hypothetical protein
MDETLITVQYVHLLDQRDGRGVRVPISLMIVNGIASVCHDDNGERCDRWFSQPTEAEMTKLKDALMAMGIEVYTMGPKRCPHCSSRAKHAECRRCIREMCEDCISHQPDVGPVCGLCFDEIQANIDREEKRRIMEAI